MYTGAATPFVGWLAVDEFAGLLAHYTGAKLVSPRPILQNKYLNYLTGGKKFEAVDSDGGDVLIIVARIPSDLNMASSISGYRKKFSKIYGIITDSYHQPGYSEITSDFDAVFVTAFEDMEYVKNRFHIPVHQMYQGIDTMRWYPTVDPIRSVDIIGFGRMPAQYQTKFTQKFHQPDCPYLYLHSPLGNVTGSTIDLERGMLFKLLQRSKISLAFNLYVGATGNRPISMMVTSRWLESMLSGCIVAGKRPVSRMADDMLHWENSTIELSDNIEDAAEELVMILQNDKDYSEQRRRNIYHVMMDHDWRLRMKNMSEICHIEFDKKLDSDMQIVVNRSLGIRDGVNR
jgi:hypothetical protein